VAPNPLRSVRGVLRVALVLAGLATSSACDAGTGEDQGPSAQADAGAMPTFGNAAGSGVGDGLGPGERLIDDGGAVLLADGAVVYLSLMARPCPEASTLTYEGFGRPFFDRYCQHCHGAQVMAEARQGAPTGLIFDDLAAIRAHPELIWSVAADTNRMMPAAGVLPTDEERRLLGDWLACGAASAADRPQP